MKQKFIIPETMNNVVKELILNTDTMDDEEKQYWFDIWDSMNESQQKRLEEILQTEKDKLEALDKKLQEKLYNLELNNPQEFEFIKDKDKSEMLKYINL